MKMFVIRACWSQTDHTNYLVKAMSKEEALEICRNNFSYNPHHWDFVCEIQGEIL